MALNAKQRLFVQEYLVDGNASAAACRAGYSAKTAGAIGHENLNKPEIAAEIARARSERAERVNLTADMVLKGLHEEANRTGEGSSHSARVAAWGLLGKHLGMFVDRHSIEAPGVTIIGNVNIDKLTGRVRGE